MNVIGFYKELFFGFLISLIIINGSCYGMDTQSESLKTENERLLKENEVLAQSVEKAHGYQEETVTLYKQLYEKHVELVQEHVKLKNIADIAGNNLMDTASDNLKLCKENEELRNSSIRITPQLYYSLGFTSVSLLILGYLGGILFNNGSQQSK
jgi:hypothetical protein